MSKNYYFFAIRKKHLEIFPIKFLGYENFKFELSKYVYSKDNYKFFSEFFILILKFSNLSKISNILSSKNKKYLEFIIENKSKFLNFNRL